MMQYILQNSHLIIQLIHKPKFDLKLLLIKRDCIKKWRASKVMPEGILRPYQISSDKKFGITSFLVVYASKITESNTSNNFV